ncbi:hypothetical protein FRACYDRAFT_235705 [Fragilariopsis cylindrus CCMP1102]|uniref:Plastid lipid-associated protein/fibrillin conserved domain-containing protein n=1 Tax=Fragilariopsis cylindrus CCMP1102 TaxID=635003 RepID=A0A1E7FNB5_9STRA|nr:hypothetical protein FRACYDRAFT_235705 [Fragilariopsis cylindrus CCMP1102]|eukprot:OEU19648.1 hypothetical protein FRACYDRAFT_235705 [Fragilariopsis cylindrus CCMP1102]
MTRRTKRVSRDCAKASMVGVSVLVLLITTATIFHANGLPTAFNSRRDFFTGTTAAFTGTVMGWTSSLFPDQSSSYAFAITGTSKKDADEILSSKLVSIIPTMEFGAPATNATISNRVSSQIEDFVSLMEETAANKNNALSEKLSGSWRLLYSNAHEIVSLSKGLPLGFYAGPIYQPLDTGLGFFENSARVNHPYNLASLQTIVVGRVYPGDKGSFNAVGIENTDNNRVDIEFELIVFQLDKILGITLDEPIRKILIPKKEQIMKSGSKLSSLSSETNDNKRQVLPANDQTYLDDNVRIVRGGDGTLFIFSREEKDGITSRMMTANERDKLFASADQNSGTNQQFSPLGKGLESQQQKKGDKIPVEIEFLLKEQTKKSADSNYQY